MLPLPPADSRRAALLALVPTTVGLVACQLPSDADWTAWVALVPLVLWAGAAPAWKRFAWTTFAAMWIAQIASMIWLRHVYPPLGYLGLTLLTAYFAIYPTLWALAARKFLPGAEKRALVLRLIDMAALAGLWVILEWIKGRLFTGCPWMPLAATQWKIAPMLTLCAYAGPAGPGFIIVLFNLGIARYARWLTGRNNSSLIRTGLPITPWSGLRFCPEFYAGLLPVFLSVFLFFKSMNSRRDTDTELFTVAAVQTDFDSNAKWDPQRDRENAGVIADATRAAVALPEGKPSVWEAGMPYPKSGNKASRPDLVLWPESALRFPVGREDYDEFLRNLATETDTTLVIGGDKKATAGGYYGGIFVVTPEIGVHPEFYAKRHLVPFGEYVPFAEINPLRKVIPVDMARGENNDPLEITLRDGRTLKLGALVCYEDIFPELARDMALRGADALVVVTNDAWYGREAGAHQHAATCAVLAASTGLPIVRCGNAGWSGVIAPNGRGEPVVNAAGSIYFRGAGRFAVRGTPADLRKPTLYVLRGDWFVSVCGVIFAFAWLRRRFARRIATNA